MTLEEMVNEFQDLPLFRKYFQEGRVRGIDEGKAEGRAEGKAEGVQLAILRLGTKKFGPPDEPSRSAILAITDLERLNSLSERLLDVDSWSDLLK